MPPCRHDNTERDGFCSVDRPQWRVGSPGACPGGAPPAAGTAPGVGAWLAVDAVTFALDPTRISAFRWAFIAFVPLWFVGMFGLACAAAPLMLGLHQRFGMGVVVGLLGVIAALEALRLGGDLAWVGVVTTPLVWLFVHQIGVLYVHSDLSSDRLCAAAVTVLGRVLIVLAVVFGPYDASMVATPGGSSNLLPTTAAIAFTGVFQAGLLGLVAPGLRRLAARRSVWKVVVTVNAFAMTILCWHMSGRHGWRLRSCRRPG